MGFQSILFGHNVPELCKESPGFFQDLQLDYLVERILEAFKEYRTEWYYYTLPKSKELIYYRQQVSKDIESEELCLTLQHFCRRLKKSRSVFNLSLKSGGVQAASYHLQAATLYWEALLLVEAELDKCSLTSEGMQDFAGYIMQKKKELQENGFVDALQRANDFFEKLTFRLSVGKDKLMITEYVAEEKAGSEKEEAKNYLAELKKLLEQETDERECFIRDIFPDPLEASYLENVLIDLLKKSKPEIFKEIGAFHMNFPKFYDEILLQFEEEVQFYLSFRQFKKRTEQKGYSLCVPSLSKQQEFDGKGVYDLALVWKQEDSGYQVVSNDFSMKDRPCFFVVTGPNQGGKTTFARSMGQAVYFTLMGLCANADFFITPMFHGISTHFEAEEKLQSNSGKLKEEINRLLPMMARIQNRKHFVILNELFTTATTHDAMIMGRKVMESFLERECYGIYVTHIQELAEETEEIISLVAQLEPGEEHKRTYRMLPMKAQGYGYSDALVKKFQLEYADIVRRLS